MRYLNVLLVIPFLDADRDAIPNNNSTLMYKFVCGPLGSNRLAIWSDFFDREPFILAQPFLRASSPYRSLARSGGLKEERSVNICMYKTINASSQQRLNLYIYIYTPRRTLQQLRLPPSFGHRSRHDLLPPPF